MRKFGLAALAIAASSLLVACGGGGGGGAGPVASTAPAAVTQGSTALNNQAANAMRALAVTLPSARTNQVWNFKAVDLTGSGREDIIVSGWNPNTNIAYIYAFIQNADGTLTDKTASIFPVNQIEGAQRVIVGDFDGDGKMDVFVPGFTDGFTTAPTGERPAHSIMFWGSGSADIAFTKDISAFPEMVTAHGACSADLNGDNKPDILVGTAGIYVNNGGRSFTLQPLPDNNTTVFYNNAFETCATQKVAGGTTIYFGGIDPGNNLNHGGHDALMTLDTSLNATDIILSRQPDATLDTIDTVAYNGGFAVAHINQTNFAAATTRDLADISGAVTTHLTQANTQFYSRTLTIGNQPAVFFAGDSVYAKVYIGTSEYKAGAFTAMAGNTNNFQPAFVYTNNAGKVYMLEILNGNQVYTLEMQ